MAKHEFMALKCNKPTCNLDFDVNGLICGYNELVFRLYICVCARANKRMGGFYWLIAMILNKSIKIHHDAAIYLPNRVS